MRCISCGYNLQGLTDHRCPECGQAFDPNDVTTFRGNPHVIDGKLCLKGSLVAWAVLGIAVCGTIAARDPMFLALFCIVAMGIATMTIWDAWPGIIGQTDLYVSRVAMWLGFALSVLLIVLTIGCWGLVLSI